MSAVEKLEKRLAALEAEVELLKHEKGEKLRDNQPWFEKIYGTFANDPDYDEAMRLGREYRESTKPRVRKKKKKVR